MRWHIVGTKREPQFLNGWRNFDDNHYPCAFGIDINGVTHIRGFVEGGEIGMNMKPIFILSNGYRPLYTLHFPIVSYNEFGYVHINHLGGVAPAIGSNVWFCLDGIMFM